MGFFDKAYAAAQTMGKYVQAKQERVDIAKNRFSNYSQAELLSQYKNSNETERLAIGQLMKEKYHWNSD